MVLVGERLGEGDWPGRRGTVISGSCRKLAVLPPFDSRESIFQVRSRLAHWHSNRVTGNNNSPAVNVQSTGIFWLVYAWTGNARFFVDSLVSICLANRLFLYSVVTSATRVGIFRETILERWLVWIVEFSNIRIFIYTWYIYNVENIEEFGKCISFCLVIIFKCCAIKNNRVKILLLIALRDF